MIVFLFYKNCFAYESFARPSIHDDVIKKSIIEQEEIVTVQTKELVMECRDNKKTFVTWHGWLVIRLF